MRGFTDKKWALSKGRNEWAKTRMGGASGSEFGAGSEGCHAGAARVERLEKL
jgi:hypothetical protein